MASYNSYLGKQYILGKKLGSGGEGTVFTVQNDSTIVAKIYKANKFKSSSERLMMERKLKTMINLNIPVRIEGTLRLAWPIDILYENGSITGFIMPNIKADCKIYDIQRADPCKKNPCPSEAFRKAYPNYTWKHLVQFAYNLSWVIKYVHSKNVIVGDFNPNNIYADTMTGAVILVDCDSFDIRDPATGEHFPCVVGLPEMLAPELQTVSHLSNATFTKETDNFSLAIHIFRLLMNNADPFGGIITLQRSSSAVATNVAIVNGECPYVKSIPTKTIPAWSPTLDMLPKEIQELFIKTFDYDSITVTRRIKNRATASEWCDALLKLAAPEPNPYLRKCSVVADHVYPVSSSYCPWCKCMQPVPKISFGQPTSVTSSSSGVAYSSTPVYPASTYQQQNSGLGVSLVPRRKPYLFYIVLIVFGLASGFTFREVVSEGCLSLIGLYIEPEACNAFLSVVGVISGALIARYYVDRYVHANNAIPWLLIGIGVLFVPLLIALAISIVVIIIMAILYIIAAIIGIIILLLILAGMISGS